MKTISALAGDYPLYLLLVSIPSFLSAQDAGRFLLNGFVKGVKQGKVYLYDLHQEGEEPVLSASLYKGRFQASGLFPANPVVPDTYICRLELYNHRQELLLAFPLFLEPIPIEIKVKWNAQGHYKLKCRGSYSQKLISGFFEEFRERRHSLASLPPDKEAKRFQQLKEGTRAFIEAVHNSCLAEFGFFMGVEAAEKGVFTSDDLEFLKVILLSADPVYQRSVWWKRLLQTYMELAPEAAALDIPSTQESSELATRSSDLNSN